MKRPCMIAELADVRVGLTMRGGQGPPMVVDSDLHLLRIGDLTEDGAIDVQQRQPVVASATLRERYRLLPGDIVVANRGNRMTAALVTRDLKALASGQLFTIRLRTRRVIAAYLHWFLNLRRTQEFLLSLAKRGGHVPTLALGVLKRDLRIPVPERGVQAKIIELAQLAAEERVLALRLNALRQRYLEQVMTSIVHQEMLE